MCESSENKNGILTMVDLFGEKKDIKATVRSLSLVDHRILVEPES
ncbi:MAG: CooT family nickel-binding protein [Deltaproteobacteria bacterium]|nr:CooT family nickel-binding protein [Deltaproteobacteria bacterium]